MAATPPSALERLRHVSWVALSTLTVTPLGPKRGLASLLNIQTSSISSPGSSLLECLMFLKETSVDVTKSTSAG